MNKLMGSYYPYCDSVKKTFKKNQDVNGIFYIENNNLIFKKTILFIKTNNIICIPLKDIKEVDTLILNGIMPFGVSVYLTDHKEYIFGHINNKKLKKFIVDAIEKMS